MLSLLWGSFFAMLCTNHECSIYVYIYAQSFNLLKIKFNILLFNNAFGRNKFLNIISNSRLLQNDFQQQLYLPTDSRHNKQQTIHPPKTCKTQSGCEVRPGQEVQKLTRMEMDQENSQPGSIEMQKCSICKDFVPRIDIRYV